MSQFIQKGKLWLPHRPPGIVVKDEGSILGRFRIVDFVGAGVVATDEGGNAKVTISGGGGVQSVPLLDGSEHTDTGAGAVVRGDVITGQGATPKWRRLAKGTVSYLLGSNGTDILWQAPFTASDTQTVVAGTAFLANASVVTLDCTGDVIMTAVPTIAAGSDGQVLTVINVDSVDDITLQDSGVLSGSLLRLGTETRVLTPGASILLVYSTDMGAWVEQRFNTLVTITPSIDSFTVDIGAGASSSQNAEVDSGGTHPATFALSYTGVPSAGTIDVSAGGDPATDWPTTLSSPYTSHVGPAFNKGTSVGTVRIFTPTITINGVPISTPTCSVTYYNRRYCGPHSDGAQLTTAEILALDATGAGQSALSNSKYGTFNNIDTVSGEFIYYCFRSALGTVAWFSIENEIALVNDEGIMSHTNDSGKVENFQQYRSENSNLGANKDFRALSSQPANRIYIGPAVNGMDVITNAQILALDDTADGESIVSSTVARTYTDIQIETGEYLWFVHPDRISDLGSIKDGTTGFAIAGSYRDNVTHTNQYGYSETYRCWRSDNPAIYPTGENVVVT